MFFKAFGCEVFVGREFVQRVVPLKLIEVEKTPDGVEVSMFRRYHVVISYDNEGGTRNGNNDADNSPSRGTSCGGGVQKRVQD